jgi:hypothetical protein
MNDEWKGLRGLDSRSWPVDVSRRLILSKLVFSLCISMLVGSLILAACGTRQPAYVSAGNGKLVSSEAAPASILTTTPQTRAYSATTHLPIVMSSDPTRLRPYTETSVWNTPIGPEPTYDTHSNEMIATIGLSGEGRISSDSTQYSYPVYFVDQSTPRWNVPCTMYDCTVVTPNGVRRPPQLEGVPIPPEAQPSDGSDAQMIIIDTLTYAEYNLFEVTRTDSGWSASNASVYNILWDGTPTEYASRGAGVPYYAGLIRPWEVARGRIEHALAFGYPEPAKDRCVFPASKTDGKSKLSYAIPEGARLQLDPTLTESDFDEMGLDRTGKKIARAMQEYGMVLIDVSGRPKVYAEDLDNNPYATVHWSDPDLNLTSETVANIPYTLFRVLELPAAYWNPTLDSPSHGECYTSGGVTGLTATETPKAQSNSTETPGPATDRFKPFGTVTVKPDFEVDGQGRKVDSIAFWEASDPADTLMFVTARDNNLVEVWRYPFVDNELDPLRHSSFVSDAEVNGVVVDQEQARLYVSVSRPASTVSIFSLPDLQFVGEVVGGAFDLKSEPNLTLLKGSDGQSRLYISADYMVYIYDAETGAQIDKYAPTEGLETMAADQYYQVIYIPDENNHTGIYAYGPDRSPYVRDGLSNFGGDGVFQEDAEGIVLYTCPSDGGSDDGSGLIVVADQRQGQADFEFFDRWTWEHLGRLRVEGVSNTDGIASIQKPLPEYPGGLFVAVNDDKSVVGVGWDKILDATDLSCGTSIQR